MTSAQLVDGFETSPYANNDPLNKTDPLGLRPEEDELRHPDPCAPYRADHPTVVADVNGDCVVDLNFPERPTDYPNAPVVSDSLQDPWNTDYCKDSWRHPTRAVACSEAFSLGFWAETTASRQFSAERDANAYRHCLWAAILVWGIGEHGDNGARGFLNRHEGSQLVAVDGYLTDSGVDRQNNEVGYSIGRTLSGWQWQAKDQCTARCLEAFRDDRLLR